MTARHVLVIPALAILLGSATAHGQSQDVEDDLLAPLTPVEKRDKPDRPRKRRQRSEPSDPSVPPGKALLHVNLVTSGKGARLLIDGEDVGTLLPGDPPRPVNPGSRKIVVRRLGYKDFVLTVPARVGSVIQVPVALEPVAGVLSVQSDTPGAEVLVDGAKVGVTPLRDLVLPPGNHEVMVRQAGFTPYVQKLSVRAGRDYEVQAQLKASDRPERDRLLPSELPETSPLQTAPPPAVASGPWFTRWYVWAGVGAAAAATAVGVMVATQPKPLSPSDVCGEGGCHDVINDPGRPAIRF